MYFSAPKNGCHISFLFIVSQIIYCQGRSKYWIQVINLVKPLWWFIDIMYIIKACSLRPFLRLINYYLQLLAGFYLFNYKNLKWFVPNDPMNMKLCEVINLGWTLDQNYFQKFYHTICRSKILTTLKWMQMIIIVSTFEIN